MRIKLKRSSREIMEPVILIGIQGSGNSAFYKERFIDTHIRINPDMLKTRNREKIIFLACLETKQPGVIDNTSPTCRCSGATSRRRKPLDSSSWSSTMNADHYRHRTARGKRSLKIARPIFPIVPKTLIKSGKTFYTVTKKHGNQYGGRQ
jgi:hypothetical protein